jgi:hypothetical protein
MALRQLSVVLPNKPGRLSRVSELLGKEGVNIRAITVVEASDFSSIRMMLDDPKKGINVLKSSGYELEESEVVAVEIPDQPGGLNAILKPLREAEVNVQYLYPYIGRMSKDAIMILGVDNIEKAKEVLEKNWIRLLGEEIYNL